MKKLSKKIMASMMVGVGMSALLHMTAEAGSIPRNMYPLHTYAVRHMDCYLSAGGQKKGYIDAGDYVIVTSVRSDGWAYGSYPAGNKRISRWFRLDDLVQNMNFANQERYSPTINTAVYTTASLKATIGTFNGNEPITVVSDNGNNRQVIYKLSNGQGYKMGWVPEWDCWTAERAGKRPVPAPQPNGNPIVKQVSRPNTNATPTPTPQPTQQPVTIRVIHQIEYLRDNVYRPRSTWGNPPRDYKEQCSGFANEIYMRLFKGVRKLTDIQPPDKYTKGSYGGSHIVGQGLWFGKNDANAVKNIFAKATPGNFVQMGRRYLNSEGKVVPHSAIYVDRDNNGCWFYEANTDNKNTIMYNYHTWVELAAKNRGFTIYEPNDYNDLKF